MCIFYAPFQHIQPYHIWETLPESVFLPDLRVGPTGGFVTGLSSVSNQPFKELRLSRMV
jgi:hypothetical protein